MATMTKTPSVKTLRKRLASLAITVNASNDQLDYLATHTRTELQGDGTLTINDVIENLDTYPGTLHQYLTERGHVEPAAPAEAPPAVEPQDAAPPVEADAPQVEPTDGPVAAPKGDDAIAAALKEKEDRERKAAETQAKIDAQFITICDTWERHDRGNRAWMPNIGGMVAPWLRLYQDANGETAKVRAEGMAKIADELGKRLGEDVAEDLNRCLSVFYASEVLNAQLFRDLPITAQKTFGAFMVRGEDGTYTLPSNVASDVKTLFAMCHTATVVPAHLTKHAVRGKDGFLHGDAVRLIGGAIKGSVKEKDATLSPFDPTWEAPKPKAKNKGTDNAPPADPTGKGGDQNAHGERGTTDAPVVKLDVKPAVAADATLSALEAHAEREKVLAAMGAAPLTTAKGFFAGIFRGMGDTLRIDELKRTRAILSKEIAVAEFMQAHPSVKREDAVKAIDKAALAAKKNEGK